MSNYIIHIKDLHTKAVLGVFDWEQEGPRPVVINLMLEISAPKAAASDELADTVDYALVESSIIQHLEATSFQLIERLASEVAQLVLATDKRIQRVSVEVDKPGALRSAKSVSVVAISSLA